MNLSVTDGSVSYGLQCIGVTLCCLSILGYNVNWGISTKLKGTVFLKVQISPRSLLGVRTVWGKRFWCLYTALGFWTGKQESGSSRGTSQPSTGQGEGEGEMGVPSLVSLLWQCASMNLKSKASEGLLKGGVYLDKILTFFFFLLNILNDVWN